MPSWAGVNSFNINCHWFNCRYGSHFQESHPDNGYTIVLFFCDQPFGRTSLSGVDARLALVYTAGLGLE